MLKLKFQYFGHLTHRTDSLEKTLMLGKIEGRRRRRRQWMRWLDGITAFMSITNSQSLLKLTFIELVTPFTVSFSVVSFSSCLQSFPAPGSFPMSLFFTSGGQSIGVSASAISLFNAMSIQDWFLLGWTGWIFLQSKGLSRVFSNNTVQKHPFFSAHLSLWSNSHIRRRLRKNHSFISLSGNVLLTLSAE